MKRTVLTIITLIALALLCACGSPAAEEEQIESGKLSIVTTMFPAYDFALQIAGDRAEVTLIVPPGSEAHSYEPTPKDIITINSCDLLICNGGESEAWVAEVIEGLDNDVKVIYMLDCVDALEEEIQEGMQAYEEEDGDEAEYDEHVWTSPVNAQLICRQICAALCEADSVSADAYTAACEDYCLELQELDAEFRTVVDNAATHTVVFADRFPVRYFVEEYGLEYYAAFPGCAEDTEPSAKTVAFLVDKVREADLPGVLYIEFSNEKMADIICEETGCTKALFHSCHNVSADDIKNNVTYLDLMRANVSSLKEVLG